MATLKHGGIVRTTLGAHGGYALAVDPTTVSIGRVIRLLDGALAPLPCVEPSLLRAAAPARTRQPAPLRDVMLDVRDAMLAILDEESLAELAARAGRAIDRSAGHPRRRARRAAALSEPAARSPATRPNGQATRSPYGSGMSVLRRSSRDAFASFVGFGRGIWLFPLDTMFRTVGLRYGWLKALFIATPAPLLRGIGRLRAERAAWRATRRVPAYGRYLEESGVDVAGLFPLGILGHLRRRTRRSYVDRYGLHRALHRWGGPLPRHDDRRVERLDRHALQLDPRPQGARRRPSQHRLLRPLRVRDGAARHAQRVLDGRLGGRFQHEPRDDAARDRQVDRAGRRQDPLDAHLSRPDVPLPDLRLSAVPEAPPRRGRAARLPVGRLRGPRPRRRRGHDRGAPRRAPASGSCRSTPATARPTSRSGWPASPRCRSPSAGWPVRGRRSVGPSSAPTRACRWSSSTTR